MRKENGFTLVELLVVIGIIGLLLAFLVLPNVMGIQDRTKETGVKAIMHAVQLALESYNADNQTYPVAANVPLKGLIENYLRAGGYLTSIPKNPFTGAEYAATDAAGKIVYNYNNDTGSYTLTGYRRDGRTRILELSNL